MSEALSSFLISVSIIVAIAFFVPCLECLVGVWRRNTHRPDEREQVVAAAKSKGGERYSRETV